MIRLRHIDHAPGYFASFETEDALVAFLLRNLRFATRFYEIHYPRGLVLKPSNFREVRKALLAS